MRALNPLLFLAGFAAISLALDHCRLDDLAYAERIAYFETHADRYDVVFFGASSTYRGVVPPVFDAAMAEQGHPLRSFNLATPGMWPHEANWLLRRILDQPPKRLRWVFIDLRGWSAAIKDANRFSDRTVAWHDAAETRSVLHSVLLQEEAWLDRLQLAGTHLLHFGMNIAHLGRGLELASTVGAWPQDLNARHEEQERLLRPRAGEIQRWQGHGPFREEDSEIGFKASTRERFLREREEWPATLAKISRIAGRVSLEAYNLAALEAQVAAVRSAGLEPVYLIPPGMRPTPHLLRLSEEGRVPLLLAFNDPEAYPELYRFENRFDRGHLAAAGARRFSELLAERFSAELAAPPTP